MQRQSHYYKRVGKAEGNRSLWRPTRSWRITLECIFAK